MKIENTVLGGCDESRDDDVGLKWLDQAWSGIVVNLGGADPVLCRDWADCQRAIDRADRRIGRDSGDVLGDHRFCVGARS